MTISLEDFHAINIEMLGACAEQVSALHEDISSAGQDQRKSIDQFYSFWQGHSAQAAQHFSDVLTERVKDLEKYSENLKQVIHEGVGQILDADKLVWAEINHVIHSDYSIDQNWNLEPLHKDQDISNIQTLSDELSKAVAHFTAVDEEVARKIQDITGEYFPDLEDRDINGSDKSGTPFPPGGPGSASGGAGSGFGGGSGGGSAPGGGGGAMPAHPGTSQVPPGGFPAMNNGNEGDYHSGSVPAGRSIAPVSSEPNPPWNDPSLSPDEQWRRALEHYKPGDPLPDPDAVTDPHLKAVGYFAKVQGMMYAYGGGHGGSIGPTNGIDCDSGVRGMDCSGSVRYALAMATGRDPGALSTYAMENEARSNNGVYSFASDPETGSPILCGDGGDMHHVVMYIGNGFVIDANRSGVPISVASLSTEPPSHMALQANL